MASACLPTQAVFSCHESADCGEAGECEDDGFCSFPDPQCESERRYGGLAPAPVANRCVPRDTPQPDSTSAADFSTSGGDFQSSGAGAETSGAAGTASSGADVSESTSTGSEGQTENSSGSESSTGTAPIERVQDGLVVLYLFDGPSGGVILDHGPPPSLNLSLTGDGYAWVPAGLRLEGEPTTTAVGVASDHSKLHDACQASHALTLEVWATPDEGLSGPSRVLSYSASASERNFSLLHGIDSNKTTTRWSSRLRAGAEAPNGMPPLESDGLEDAGMKHIVFVHDGPEDVKISSLERLYIDGAIESEGVRAAGFENWEFGPGMVLGVGNEVGGGRAFKGVIHLAAVYCRALAPAEVLRNFEAGLG